MSDAARRKAKPRPTIGARFGRLVIVAAVDWTDDDWRAGDFRWLVRCDCGSVAKEVTSEALLAGTRSCGCLVRDKSTNAQRRDYLPAAPVVPYLKAWHERHRSRPEHDYSLRQLADRAGTTDRTLRRYVTGEQKNITVASAERLAEALGETAAGIWGGAEPTNRAARTGGAPAPDLKTGRERLFHALVDLGLSPDALRPAAALCCALDACGVGDADVAA
jgi:transcriptional regulator with XRE-family HTH domain